jgi:hypothetical protein
MGIKPKAILPDSQALIVEDRAGDADGTMANPNKKDALDLASRIKAAFAATGDRESDVKRAICQELRISPQALNGWVKTGRIAKGKLPVVARHTGQSLDYFLGQADMTAQEQSEVELVLAARSLPDSLRQDLLNHAQSLIRLSESLAQPPDKKQTK